MFLRTILTVALLAVCGMLNNIWAGAHGILSAELAGNALLNSDSASLTNTYGQRGMLVPYAALSLLCLVGLLVIWRTPLKKLFAAVKDDFVPVLVGCAVLGAVASLGSHPAHAFYASQNAPENLMVQPNEAMFWVPDQGANKDTQVKLNSPEYWRDNRIAAKLFPVPHRQLENLGWGPWGGYWVSSGHAILLDLTPFNREWTGSTTSGTSARDESIKCQDLGGLDATFDVGVIASVSYDDAPMFLSKFGIDSITGSRTDPNVVFQTVWTGRDLRRVMDTYGRTVIGINICNAASARGVDDINKNLGTILKEATEVSKKTLADRGITLDALGWVGTVSFDRTVQSAMNRKYVASKDAEIAALLAPHADVLRTLAIVDATRTLAAKSDGHGPQTIVGLPPAAADLLQTLVGVAQPTKK